MGVGLAKLAPAQAVTAANGDDASPTRKTSRKKSVWGTGVGGRGKVIRGQGSEDMDWSEMARVAVAAEFEVRTC